MATIAYSLTRTAWVDLGATPCVVQVVDDFDSALIVVADAAPADFTTRGLVLSSSDQDGSVIDGGGQHVWARALNFRTTAIVRPAPGGTGGSGSSAGSTGLDFSANKPAIPASGSVLLATIPVSASRAYVEVQNQSNDQIQVVRDDGVGAQQSVVLLAPGGANAQGGGWASRTFRGRLRVYGPAGSQFAAFQD